MHKPLLDQALAFLAATKNSWPEVSKASGVPYSTMTKIFQRVIKDPRVSTVQRLLDHRDAASPRNNYPNQDSTGGTIPEIALASITPLRVNAAVDSEKQSELAEATP